MCSIDIYDYAINILELLIWNEKFGRNEFVHVLNLSYHIILHT